MTNIPSIPEGNDVKCHNSKASKLKLVGKSSPGRHCCNNQFFSDKLHHEN